MNPFLTKTHSGFQGGLLSRLRSRIVPAGARGGCCTSLRISVRRRLQSWPAHGL